MHQPGVSPGLVPDPAGDRFVAAPRRDHQVRPRRAQGAGAPPVYTPEAGSPAQVNQQLPGASHNLFLLAGKIQLGGEGPHLGIVPCLASQQTPDFRPGHPVFPQKSDMNIANARSLTTCRR